MKPKRIILIRHGESEGNVDKSIYTRKPDYAINLTDVGRQQCIEAGQKLDAVLGNQSIQAYVSPFYRTRQTFQGVTSQLKGNIIMREDPRLREQEWCGSMRPEGYNYAFEDERDAYGHFYYRFHGGESCADVYNRVTTFLDTLHRDFEKQDFPDNAIIFTHGMTLRVIVMRWFHMTVEEFEFLRNPKNCQYYILELQPDNKYKLITEMEKYPSRRCIY